MPTERVTNVHGIKLGFETESSGWQAGAVSSAMTLNVANFYQKAPREWTLEAQRRYTQRSDRKYRETELGWGLVPTTGNRASPEVNGGSGGGTFRCRVGCIEDRRVQIKLDSGHRVYSPDGSFS